MIIYAPVAFCGGTARNVIFVVRVPLLALSLWLGRLVIWTVACQLETKNEKKKSFSLKKNQDLLQTTNVLFFLLTYLSDPFVVLLGLLDWFPGSVLWLSAFGASTFLKAAASVDSKFKFRKLPAPKKFHCNQLRTRIRWLSVKAERPLHHVITMWLPYMKCQNPLTPPGLHSGLSGGVQNDDILHTAVPASPRSAENSAHCSPWSARQGCSLHSSVSADKKTKCHVGRKTGNTAERKSHTYLQVKGSLKPCQVSGKYRWRGQDVWTQAHLLQDCSISFENSWNASVKLGWTVHDHYFLTLRLWMVLCCDLHHGIRRVTLSNYGVLRRDLHQRIGRVALSNSWVLR